MGVLIHSSKGSHRSKVQGLPSSLDVQLVGLKLGTSDGNELGSLNGVTLGLSEGEVLGISDCIEGGFVEGVIVGVTTKTGTIGTSTGNNVAGDPTGEGTKNGTAGMGKLIGGDTG